MVLVQTSSSALWFFPFVAPICVWAAWTDLKFMKIPNKAVIALLGVFLVVGLAAIPISDYPLRLLQVVVILVVGFALNVAKLIGAGDAKFAAAMAAYVPLGDLRLLVVLFAAVLVAAFFTHRMFRALPVLQGRTVDWKSWSVSEFPMGLALGGTLAFYLALGVLYGA